jgi:hypothetical protein
LVGQACAPASVLTMATARDASKAKPVRSIRASHGFV